jgi:hypothetical protein
VSAQSEPGRHLEIGCNSAFSSSRDRRSTSIVLVDADHFPTDLGWPGTEEGLMMLFAFPGDARWSETAEAVLFSVRLGEYEGAVTVPRHVFRRLIGGAPSPEQCLEYYHLHRTAFERATEHKIHRRDLTDDGNVELASHDFRRIAEAPS